MRIKRVRQKDEYGCGVACVAVLLDIDYDQILKTFDNGNRKAEQEGFTCKDICSALKKFGKKYSYRYVKPRLKNRIYKEGTIVYIKKTKKYPAGHYLLRVKDRWMDPWINFNRDKNIKNAKAGLRKQLPGKAIYYLQR